MTVSIEADPVMDPKKAECVGHYLYGSGYYASQNVQAAIVLGTHMNASFCNECPVNKRCQERHRERTAALLPEEWERYIEQVRLARKRGVSELVVEAVLARAGQPSPLMSVALHNYKQGVEHKRRVTGQPLERKGAK